MQSIAESIDRVIFFDNLFFNLDSFFMIIVSLLYVFLSFLIEIDEGDLKTGINIYFCLLSKLVAQVFPPEPSGL